MFYKHALLLPPYVTLGATAASEDDRLMALPTVYCLNIVLTVPADEGNVMCYSWVFLILKVSFLA